MGTYSGTHPAITQRSTERWNDVIASVSTLAACARLRHENRFLAYAFHGQTTPILREFTVKLSL